MSGIEIQLRRIQEKLNALLKEHAGLQQENAGLKSELELAKKEQAKNLESMERLRQQVDILKYTNAEMSLEEKKEFEKRINTYLKEIDRCIVMLGQ